MKTNYIVCDETGNVSYSAKTEAPESFTTFRAAEKRAKELADTSPGQTIGIFELVGEAIAAVAKPESARKYPLEHYR